MERLTTEFGLCVMDNMKQEFQQSIREKYIDKLVDNLKDRFADSALLMAAVSSDGSFSSLVPLYLLASQYRSYSPSIYCRLRNGVLNDE